MCSIGHDEAPDTPATPRRHSDGTMVRVVRSMSRKALEGERTRMTERLRAELRASRDAREATEIADGHAFGDQYELIPPDEAQLPPHRVHDSRLPPASSLYYSAAREA